MHILPGTESLLMYMGQVSTNIQQIYTHYFSYIFQNFVTSNNYVTFQKTGHISDKKKKNYHKLPHRGDKKMITTTEQIDT